MKPIPRIPPASKDVLSVPPMLVGGWRGEPVVTRVIPMLLSGSTHALKTAAKASLAFPLTLRMAPVPPSCWKYVDTFA